MEDKNYAYFPYKFEELGPEEIEDMARVIDFPNDYVSVGPKRYKLLRPYCDEAANIYNMPVRDSDIFVATYQRSGTTWAQELVWLLANNFDYDTAASVELADRFPFLEVFMFYNKKWQETFEVDIENKKAALALIEKLATPLTNKLLAVSSPRFIKTHLPMSLLPPTLVDTAKVVYVARDPRDVAVSCYHHIKLFKILSCPRTFKEFWQLFIKDLFILTPIFEHVKEAWQLRHHPNMLFVFYEELSKNLPATIRRIATFLGKEVTHEQMARLCDHLSFKNFKNNHSVNFEEIRKLGFLATDESFIRNGKTGGWREYFDEEMAHQAEQWIADNLRDTDLRFPLFEIHHRS